MYMGNKTIVCFVCCMKVANFCTGGRVEVALLHVNPFFFSELHASELQLNLNLFKMQKNTTQRPSKRRQGEG